MPNSNRVSGSIFAYGFIEIVPRPRRVLDQKKAHFYPFIHIMSSKISNFARTIDSYLLCLYFVFCNNNLYINNILLCQNLIFFV